VESGGRYTVIKLNQPPYLLAALSPALPPAIGTGKEHYFRHSIKPHFPNSDGGVIRGAGKFASAFDKRQD
jgi:hypothetical protein